MEYEFEQMLRSPSLCKARFYQFVYFHSSTVMPVLNHEEIAKTHTKVKSTSATLWPSELCVPISVSH